MSVSAPASTRRRRRSQRGSGEQLRAEIIAAAKQLLASAADADDVSIRAVADAVGVTPPSIYLHFADKNELLGAVVSDVFTALDGAMLHAAVDITTPMGKLRAYGLAYVKFAVAHPEHYRIATMDPCPVPVVDEVLASSAFVHFNDTVIECIEAGIFPAGDPLPITLDLWAAAHGIASLMIAKPFLPWGDVEATADRMLCAAAIGHAVQTLIGDAPTTDQVMAWIDAQHGARGSGD